MIQRPIGGGEGTDVPGFSTWAGLCLHPRGMRGVLASCDAPSARSSDDQRVSESLQGRKSWPSPTPRRCHDPVSPGSRVHRMSPVFTRGLLPGATIVLIEPLSENIQRNSPTCVADDLLFAVTHAHRPA